MSKGARQALMLSLSDVYVWEIHPLTRQALAWRVTPAGYRPVPHLWTL